jgi:hypothetical protein
VIAASSDASATFFDELGSLIILFYGLKTSPNSRNLAFVRRNPQQGQVIAAATFTLTRSTLGDLPG